MRLKYLLYLLFFVALWFVGVTDGFAESSANVRDTKSGTIWHDPFYAGPFGMRVWTDVTGDHRVKGRFVELLVGNVVRLQRPDGRFLRIPLDQLSRADRNLVRLITPDRGKEKMKPRFNR
ncbi:MAG: SHD1 domain-containing protein [Planctomycetia bacterium]|jgi:hypothetical protein